MFCAAGASAGYYSFYFKLALCVYVPCDELQCDPGYSCVLCTKLPGSLGPHSSIEI